MAVTQALLRLAGLGGPWKAGEGYCDQGYRGGEAGEGSAANMLA